MAQTCRQKGVLSSGSIPIHVKMLPWCK